jgi:aconitate hydratase
MSFDLSQITKKLLIKELDGFLYYSLNKLFEILPILKKLPFAMKIVLENLLRNAKNDNDAQNSIQKMINWLDDKKNQEIEFYPSRVLMQDFTGVPAVVDLAAMRDCTKKIGIDAKKINPLIPVDLVIDHSVQVNSYATRDSLQKNIDDEYDQNIERYKFLKWGQKAFENFRVVPPGMGICHQVNLEYLASVIFVNKQNNTIYPETIIGTDSHTTMINGLSVLGWGVGGIEAEAVMLGESISMVLPEVIGFRLTGRLREGVTATDLVLTVTNMLRKKGVVGKFVEFFGEGLKNLALPDRATIANMAPEYGATCGFFPIDEKTIDYLKLTNRDESQISLVEKYAKSEELWNKNDECHFTDVIELDLSKVEASLAGPTRPQDQCFLRDIRKSLIEKFTEDMNLINQCHKVENSDFSLKNGDLVLAAITSCTNTSNPSVLIGAGLLAKKAIELGLIKSKPWVKTSLAPGSLVVTEYLNKSGLTKYLDELGFNTVGYGCTTCIGNSGPLLPEIDKTIRENDLCVGAILSGNRNFEGRIHPLIKANYLASPPLVVAFALCGRLDIDLEKEPIGIGFENKEIYLKDIWPTDEEIERIIKECVTRDLFKAKYATVFNGEERWKKIEVVGGDTYEWDKNSTYIQNPPYFDNFDPELKETKLQNIKSARILALFDDSITTDHISPAGNIKETSPAGLYLKNHSVEKKDFNSYGARRGNHEVMMRGTFANVRLKNRMVQVEGGYTIHYEKNLLDETKINDEMNHGSEKETFNHQEVPIYDACMKYKEERTPLVIFAGKEYGSGSSRDWAAKGTFLLGVNAVIAESFERIHRSNLIGMGVIPLTFLNGENKKSLVIDGDDFVDIVNLDKVMHPKQKVVCVLRDRDGKEKKRFELLVRIDTEIELDIILNGGIMHKVLKRMKND